MTIKRASLLINTVTICVIVVNAILLVYYNRKISEADKAAADRFCSILLVDELHISSEELTRQVRNYATTGFQAAEDTYTRFWRYAAGRSRGRLTLW